MKGYSQMICEIANHVNYLDLKFSDSLMFRKMVLVLIMPQYMAILIILTVRQSSKNIGSGRKHQNENGSCKAQQKYG